MINAIQSAYNPVQFQQATYSQMNDATLSAERLEAAEGDKELREAFGQFVGETFFGQMLSAMRKTVGKDPYFHGGRAEEMFQSQLDQVMAEEMSKASAESFTGPMFELFQLKRS